MSLSLSSITQRWRKDNKDDVDDEALRCNVKVNIDSRISLLIKLLIQDTEGRTSEGRERKVDGLRFCLSIKVKTILDRRVGCGGVGLGLGVRKSTGQWSSTMEMAEYFVNKVVVVTEYG